jgi:hypothetical protein
VCALVEGLKDSQMPKVAVFNFRPYLGRLCRLTRKCVPAGTIYSWPSQVRFKGAGQIGEVVSPLGAGIANSQEA